MGDTNNCDVWTVPRYGYINKIQISVDLTKAPVYIKVTMNDGKTFEKGFRSFGSTENFEEFTQESMLIGLKGNENPFITAIGFLRYTCMPPIIDPSL